MSKSYNCTIRNVTSRPRSKRWRDGTSAAITSLIVTSQSSTSTGTTSTTIAPAALSSLSDVSIANAQTGDMLRYTEGKWLNVVLREMTADEVNAIAADIFTPSSNIAI